MPPAGNSFIYMSRMLMPPSRKPRARAGKRLNDPADMFWGDRVGTLQDEHGNTWKLAHRVREVTPEEMQEAMKHMAQAS